MADCQSGEKISAVRPVGQLYSESFDEWTEEFHETGAFATVSLRALPPGLLTAALLLPFTVLRSLELQAAGVEEEHRIQSS